MIARQALGCLTVGIRPTGRTPAPALVNGATGVVVTMRGRTVAAIGFTITDGKIAEIDSIADPNASAESQQLPSTTSSRTASPRCLTVLPRTQRVVTRAAQWPKSQAAQPICFFGNRDTLGWRLTGRW